MSDARTQAIHKAATELVQELLEATKAPGRGRWFHIIVRKMEGLPDRCPPKPPNPKMSLTLGSVRFDLTSLGLTISSTSRDRHPITKGYLGPEKADELPLITNNDLTKLKLWLNGE